MHGTTPVAFTPAAAFACAGLAGTQERSNLAVTLPCAHKTTKTAAREAGAKRLQNNGSATDLGHPGAPADALPPGDPKLAWSFNRDDELRPERFRQRDRQHLHKFVHPRPGVASLQGTFARPATAVAGVPASK